MTEPRLELLKLTDIVKHPKNPRHRAVADAELVESIKANGVLQPVLVAPTDDGKHMLLAGHRRVDGAKKAKLKAVQAVIRDDLNTEGQQIEAMLIENGRREDLTPIEEAEGFEQLMLIGYKQKDIAKATGRDPKTVSARLKLLKLASSTRNRVHKGQLTIEDALAITEFADDPDITKKLEQAANGDGYGFKYALQDARRRKKATQATAAELADLRDRGIPEHTPAEGDRYGFFDGVDGVEPIYRTPLRSAAEHDGCLVFAEGKDYMGDPSVSYGCNNPTSHEGQLLSEDEKRRRDAAEAIRVERERAAAANESAAKVRAGTMLTALGQPLLPKAVTDLVRALLPALVADLDGTALATYQELVGIPEDRRWQPGYMHSGRGVGNMNATHLADHVEDIRQYSDNVVPRVLVAALVAVAEANVQTDYGQNKAIALQHFEFLEQLGHEFCDVDDEIRGALEFDDAEQAS